jgi:branched-chain amino acid transport system substrate-binding protein
MRLLNVVFIVLALLLVNGCEKKEPETIKIGAILPLTGQLSEVGENAKNGILLALDEVNEKLKTEEKEFKIITEDSKTNPKDAVAAFNKLINIDKIDFVIGEIASGPTLAIASIAEQNKKILISPGASSPKISNAGEYVFRTWHSTAYEGSFFAKYLNEVHNVKKIGILYINNDYGIGIVDKFTEVFKSTGGDIIFMESFEQNQSNFRPVLNKVIKLSKMVDGIYLVSYYIEAGILIKQARELEISSNFFCSDAIQDPKLIEIAGNAVENIIYPHAKAPNTNNPVIKNFQAKYKMKYGKEYGPTSDTAYDAFNLLSLAIENVGYNSSLVKDYLLDIKKFNGASGQITFDKNGDVLKEMDIKTVRNGKFELYH